MRALSIRQPFAELILRGMKTIEYRSRPTRIIGERFYIYAARGTKPRRHEGTEGIYASRGGTKAGRHEGTKGIWSVDLAAAEEPLAPWMVELAEGLRMWKPGELPTGVIVGSAVIERCVEVASVPLPVVSTGTAADDSPATASSHRTTMFEWHLRGVERASRLRKPRGHPQPVWFEPF
ncbi:MAG TPA: ASCH domain-containing protein [Tepidisphaeraceae bacterium]|nr:ASCH domain-containing protein [Tepidisphaeraceae bacterium]